MSMGLPTLSSAGYIDDPAQKLDSILAYFFIADQSQSNHHRGLVSSLPFIIKQYSDNVNALISSTEEALIRMCSVYFDSCSITASVQPSTTNDNEYNLIIEGSVSSDKKQFSIYKLLIVSNNKISNINDILIM